MRIEYHDEVLRRLAEERGYAPTGWDPALITSYRKKVQIISAAVDARSVESLLLTFYRRFSTVVGTGPSRARSRGAEQAAG